jgi:predicted nucleic acid-binding protein
MFHRGNVHSGSVGGHRFQAPLWILRNSARLVLIDLTSAEVDRTEASMEKYHDVPMDLADASLIAVAEARDLKEVFSFDSDFRIFRLANGSVLEVVPA